MVQQTDVSQPMVQQTDAVPAGMPLEVPQVAQDAAAGNASGIDERGGGGATWTAPPPALGYDGALAGGASFTAPGPYGYPTHQPSSTLQGFPAASMHGSESDGGILQEVQL